ncbi:MAG: MaoC family dehydratase [Dehalococcoidia bacterium]|nr:MaoC family dehydratase [Dehalococcoidia bacterium]
MTPSETSPDATPTPPAVEPVTRLIDQTRVDRYAVAAHDLNPIHRETPEARAGQFGRPIAHGMLVLALVSEAMAATFGDAWAEGGELRVRWRSPALTPVTITARAEPKSLRDGIATYNVVCEDESGQLLLSGTASAPHT